MQTGERIFAAERRMADLQRQLCGLAARLDVLEERFGDLQGDVRGALEQCAAALEIAEGARAAAGRFHAAEEACLLAVRDAREAARDVARASVAAQVAQYQEYVRKRLAAFALQLDDLRQGVGCRV